MAGCCSITTCPYTTVRVVQIPNKCLSITYYVIVILVILYIGGYGLIYEKGYQKTSPIESVVVTKVKGVFRTNYTDYELGVPSPEHYRRVWDASDTIIPAQGEESGGFIVITNIVITPNQTRGVCPESITVENSTCQKDSDCEAGKVLNIGNGPMTGKCRGASISFYRTCEIDSWCPLESEKIPLQGMRKALLEETKEFTVLVKNSVEFPFFGDKYKKRNILEDATSQYLQNCLYNAKTDPYCPTFRIGDIINLAGGDRYEKVALSGGVFALKIKWYCSFDFGDSINNCRPKYSFARLDNPNVKVGPGFNFRSVVFHEENRRTMTRNYGLKIVIDVEGEGRKFDSVKVILAIGAGMGLFAIASLICDLLLNLFCILKPYFSWKWLQFYSDGMKYDLSYIQKYNESKKSRSRFNDPTELEEIGTLRQQ